jgi:hypothetical protein
MFSWKSVKWEPVCSTRTDGRTDEKNEVQTDMAKLIVAFRNSVKAPDKL